MNKNLLSFVAISFILMVLGLVIAQSGNPQGSANPEVTSAGKSIGGDKDEHGCLIAAGYSWNETEEKCVREWETGESRYQNENQLQNKEMIQEKVQARLEDGEHMGPQGQTIKVMTQANNRKQLEVGGVKAQTGLEIETETEGEMKKMMTTLSNGKNAEIKVMPDKASETALERLRLRVCSEENDCSIELKEVGNGEEKQLAYEVQVERHSRILGIFAKKMQVKAEVNAENGELIRVKKPWWAFIAAEPAE